MNEIKIKRIDVYMDCRFSKKVLYQHGAYMVENQPYEIEIVSENMAIVRGENPAFFDKLIEDFRFYAPHINTFLDNNGVIISKFNKAEVFEIDLDLIQPSQFYIDEEKLKAVSSFIKDEKDIIVQVIKWGDRYISLDGHTRLYYAFKNNFEKIRAVISDFDDDIFIYVKEAQKRGIFKSRDLKLVSHNDYETLWYGYCDEILKN